jgi:hypothetical protein
MRQALLATSSARSCAASTRPPRRCCGRWAETGRPPGASPTTSAGPGQGADGGPGGGAGLTDGQRHAWLAAELRFRLPAMEIRSPAILPGGSRANALASIAESSGVSGAGIVSALIRLASLLWPGPRRIRARVCGEPTRHLVLSPDLSVQLLDVAARDLREVRPAEGAARSVECLVPPGRAAGLAAALAATAPPALPGRRACRRAADRRPAQAHRAGDLLPRPLDGTARPAGPAAALRDAARHRRRPGWATGLPREFRGAVKIASFIAGDEAYLNAVLTTVLSEPFGPWPALPRRPCPPTATPGTGSAGCPGNGARGCRTGTGRAGP